jgi:hypothetical protein
MPCEKVLVLVVLPNYLNDTVSFESWCFFSLRGLLRWWYLKLLLIVIKRAWTQTRDVIILRLIKVHVLYLNLRLWYRGLRSTLCASLS